MPIRTTILTLIASASLAFAQLDSNSVTVTATRNTTALADQATFSVTLNAPLNATLDDVLAALHGAGPTASNFNGIQVIPGQIIPGRPIANQPTPTPTLNWNFRLSAPLNRLKDTVTTLNDRQQAIAQKKNGMTVSFAAAGIQVGSPTTACTLSDVLSDARAQAQKLADAAGQTLGVILALSSDSPCSATVKFALRF